MMFWRRLSRKQEGYHSRMGLLVVTMDINEHRYASFCKHIFIPNFTTCYANATKIDETNESKIKSGYAKRRETELAVLRRWVTLEPTDEYIQTPAKFLDLILYSREQVNKENEAMGEKDGKSQNSLPAEAPNWFIVSIKPQNEDYELPMEPITMFRNSMISEGGSGVGIDPKAYSLSVDFWDNHVAVQVNK
eukprot:Filipodium_phascolosomae@DN3048_c0_g1_i1.p1